jgi:hypothetical protein
MNKLVMLHFVLNSWRYIRWIGIRNGVSTAKRQTYDLSMRCVADSNLKALWGLEHPGELGQVRLWDSRCFLTEVFHSDFEHCCFHHPR